MKWIVGALLLLLVGALLSLGLLVYAMYVLLGVLLISRTLARQWVDHLSVQRSCDGAVFEIGDSIDVAVAVRNESHLPVAWLLLEDSLPTEALTQQPPRLSVSGDRLRLTRLGARSEETLQYTVNFLMRGYYQIGPLFLESGDLFGLHRRYRVATEPHFVSVLPRVVPLEGYDLASRHPVGEVRMTHRLFEDPTRIAGVRPYQTGDPLNRIHWRATARTGVFHSKSYEPSAVAGATIVLDFHQTGYSGRGAVHKTELAVTTVASLANALHQMNQRVGFITNGRDAADRIREEGWNKEFRTRALARSKAGMSARSDRLRPIVIETRRDAEQLPRILETLARLELTDGFTFAQLVSETGSRLPRNATVAAVLADVPPETALALSSLRQQGYAVTAALVVFDAPREPDWAKLPDWASWLLAAGIEVRRVENEAALAHFCSEQLLR